MASIEKPTTTMIAQYKFNSSLYDLFPEFNEGFAYTYEDTTEGDIVTRTIYSSSLPTLMRFGEIGNSSNRTNSLLEVSYLNTSNLTTMQYMFSYCQSLTSVNTSNWNTDKVENMSSMFYYCSGLTQLDVSSWNTTNVIDMNRMFYFCSFTSLDLSNFNTSNVTEMGRMFAYCNQMTEVNLSGWNVDKVANVSMMFAYCNKLDTIKIYNCKSNVITTIKYSSVFPTETISGKTRTIYCDEAIAGQLEPPTNWVFGSEEVSGIKIMEYKFNNTIYDLIPEFNAEFIDYTYKDVVNGTETIRTIYSNNLPTKIKFGSASSFNYDNRSRSLLEVLYLNTSNLNTMYQMFLFCSNLVSVSASDWDVSNVTNMESAFDSCDKLTTVGDLSNWNTGKVTNVQYMFYSCLALTALNANNWNMEGINSLYCSFYNCKSLETINMDGWNLNNLSNVSSVFDFCSNLKNITMKDTDYNSVNNMVSLLPTRTSAQPGAIDITGVDDVNQINTSMANSKYWNIVNQRQMKIMEYKFNNTSYDLIPEFNVEFTDYTHEDIVEGNIVTRTIYSNSLPTKIKFGSDSSFGYDNKSNSLLEILYLDASNLNTMYQMFLFCRNLTSIDVSNWNVSNVTNMESVFDSCDKLTTVGDLSNWNISNVTNMQYMFYNCQALEEININNWNANNASSMQYIFYNCIKLNSIFMNNSNYSSVNKVISQLPTRTANAMGALNITGIDDVSQVDISTAESKYWNVVNEVQIKIAEYKFTKDVNGTAELYKLDQPTVFNGTSFIDTGIQLLKEDTDWTIFADFIPTAHTGVAQCIFHCLDEYGSSPGMSFSIEPSHVQFWNGTTYDVRLTDASYPGKKIRVVIVKSGNETTVYHSNNDTMYQITSPSTYAYTFRETNSTLSIGAGHAEDTIYYPFTGTINDFVIYDGILNEQECNSLITNGVVDLIPEFNAEFEYTYEDIVEGNTVTRTIYSNNLPTFLRFGYRDGEHGDANSANSLLEVNYLATDELTTMRDLFRCCNNLSVVNAEGWNTSNVTDLKCTFEYCTALTELDLSSWDINQVYATHYTFAGCTNLISVNMDNWDTGNLEDMSYMFYKCENLLSLDLSKFDMHNVVNMMYIFGDCYSLTSIGNVSNWVTDKLSNASYMFSGCYMLESLDLSNWNVEKVTDMSYMFNYCEDLITIGDVGNWNTKNVTNMNYMFRGCYNLTSLNVSNWDVSNVTTMYETFAHCRSLTSIKGLSNWNTSKVTNMYSMFWECISLIELNLSGWDTSKVTSMTWLLCDCYNLKMLNLSGWDITNNDISDMFSPYSYSNPFTLNKVIMNNSNYASVNKIITQLPTRTAVDPGTLQVAGINDISQVNTTAANTKYWNVVENIKIAQYKFNNSLYNLIPDFNEGFTYTYEDVVNGTETTRTIYSKNLPTMIRFGVESAGATNNRCNSLLEISFLETSELTTMHSIVDWCTNLTSINSADWITNKVTDMVNAFHNCYALSELDVSGFDTHNVIEMRSVFLGCNSLSVIDVSNWDTSKSTSFRYMFDNCNAVSVLDLSNFDTGSANTMYAMFSDCCNTTVNVKHFDVANVTDFSYMFDGKVMGSVNNDTIDLSTWNAASALKMGAMFYMNKARTIRLPKTINAGLTNINMTDAENNNFGMFYSDKLEYIDFGGLDLTNVVDDKSLVLQHVPNLKYIESENANLISDLAQYLPTRSENNKGSVITTANISNEIKSILNAKHWDIINSLYKIAEYKFNSAVYDLFPDFNEGYLYSYSDEYLDTDNIVVRTIYSTSLPIKISFGQSSIEPQPKEMSLLGVEYLNITQETKAIYNLFARCTNLEYVNGTNDWDISGIDALSTVFYACNSLKSIDVSSWDTRNATNMYCMFAGCTALESLNLSNWDTSNVIDMAYMFNGCRSLTLLDVSNFDTSKVPDMQYMFSNCSALSSLDLSNFDTSKVTNMQYMFSRCYELNSIIGIEDLDVSKVTSMNSMFFNSKVSELDLSNWKTDSLTNIDWMFCDCYMLRSLNVTGWNTSQLTQMIEVFAHYERGNHNLIEIIGLNTWDVSNVVAFEDLFWECRSLESLDLSGWDVRNATYMGWMFCDCESLKSLKLNGWHLNANVACTSMFDSYEYTGCSSLTSIEMNNSDYNSVNKIITQLPARTATEPGILDVIGVDNASLVEKATAESKNWNVIDQAKIKIAEYKFDNTVYDLIPEFNEGYTYTYENVVEGNVTTRTIYSYELPTLMRFGDNNHSEEVTSLLQVDYLDTSNVTDMSHMFDGCTNVEYINTSNWDTSKVTNMEYMFCTCSSLIEIDVSNFNTSNVTDIIGMFYDCPSLIELDVTNFDVSKIINLGRMFSKCKSLKTIKGISNWDVSNVETLEHDDWGIFDNCESLTELDLSNWDVSNVTNMNYMFTNCYELTSVGDLSNWKTGNVTNMYEMFRDCQSLQELNLTNWNVSNATSMKSLFRRCYELKTVGDLSNWNTGNVTDMRWMFEDCFVLESVGDLSNWNTSKVTDMTSMFNYCHKLKELNLANWDTSKVTNMYLMFIKCYELESLNLSGWDMTLVESTGSMLESNSKLKTIIMNNSDYNSINKIITELPTRTEADPGTLDIIKVDDISLVNVNDANTKYWNVISQAEIKKIAEYKFDNTLYDLIPEFNEGFEYTYEDTIINNITTRIIYSDNLPTRIRFGADSESNRTLSLLEVIYLNTNNLDTMSGMFKRCHNVTTINASNWDIRNVDSMYETFYKCLNLKEIDVSSFDTSNVVTMEAAFYRCNNLTNIIGIENWDTSNVTNMSWMFTDCESLIKLDLNWDTGKVTDMSYMFSIGSDSGCYSLEELNVSSWNVANVTNMFEMFYGCASLEELDVSNWDTSNVTDISEMFCGCELLTSIDVSNWDTNKVTNMAWIFEDCQSLTTLDLSNWDVSKVTSMEEMINECYELTTLDISNWKLKSDVISSSMFVDTSKLSTVIMNNSDYNSVNKIIQSLTARSANDKGTMSVASVDDMSKVYVLDASNKNWTVTDQYIVAKYKFDNTLADLIPEFNNEFTYTHEDVVEGSTTTRTIYSNELPTLMRFGYSGGGWTNTDDRANSLLEIIYLDASGLTTAFKMFKSCTNLQRINCNLNINDKMTNLQEMFYICLSLESIENIAHWNTSNVIYAQNLFAECKYLNNIDLSNWDTSKIVNMTHMFYNCQSLTQLDLSNWNTSKVTDMKSMFQSCNSLTSLDASNWNTGNVTNMDNMFKNCTNLTSVDISSWDTSKVTTMYMMFDSCTNLITVDLSNLDVNSANNLSYMFNGCNKLITIGDVGNWDISKTTNIQNMFTNCYALTNVNVSNWDTSEVTSMRGVFYNCRALTEIDVSNWRTNKVITMEGIFQGCESLTSLDVSNWNTSNVTNMSNMFRSCYSLSLLDTSNFDISNVTTIYAMFDNCHSIKSLDLSNGRTDKINDMRSAFNRCLSLKSLNISNWSVNDAVSFGDTFDCDALTNIIINNSDYNTVNKIIAELLIRTADSMGTLDIVGIDDDSQVNITAAQAKYWNVSKVKQYKVHKITAENKKINNVYNQNKKIKISIYKE